MRTWLPVLLAFATPSALAHPFSKDEYSLAQAVQASESGLAVVVIIEVPIPVVLDQVQARLSAGASKKKALEDHDREQWDKLGAGLTLRVNGKAVPVSWRPVEHPSNGKVADGFFTYWVGAKTSLPASASSPEGSTVVVQVENRAWPDAKMVYTGSAVARDGWSVASNSATTVLGLDVATADKMDPAAWSNNPALRTLRVEFRRGP
jgi:hypothetical protein